MYQEISIIIIYISGVHCPKPNFVDRLFCPVPYTFDQPKKIFKKSQIKARVKGKRDSLFIKNDI